jgi:hypothetical protein
VACKCLEKAGFVKIGNSSGANGIVAGATRTRPCDGLPDSQKKSDGMLVCDVLKQKKRKANEPTRDVMDLTNR